MMLLRCPWCGHRDGGEFRYVGESLPRPDPAVASPQEWRRYLYVRANPCDWVRETWYHRAGCRRYFTTERHTATNEVRASGAAR